MKLLELVPCCRKGVSLDSDGLNCHFPAIHRVSNDSEGTVPIHELESGRINSVVPVKVDSDEEFHSQIRRRSSRRSSRRNGRNSLLNSPEHRRLLSSMYIRQWKPSLDVISEDRVVGVAGNEDRVVRSAKKGAGKHESAAKLWGYSVRDDIRQGPAQTSISAFSPTAFLF